MDYYDKYLYYKNKYLALKNKELVGGENKEITIYINENKDTETIIDNNKIEGKTLEEKLDSIIELTKDNNIDDINNKNKLITYFYDKYKDVDIKEKAFIKNFNITLVINDIRCLYNNNYKEWLNNVLIDFLLSLNNYYLGNKYIILNSFFIDDYLNHNSEIYDVGLFKNNELPDNKKGYLFTINVSKVHWILCVVKFHKVLIKKDTQKSKNIYKYKYHIFFLDDLLWFKFDGTNTHIPNILDKIKNLVEHIFKNIYQKKSEEEYQCEFTPLKNYIYNDKYYPLVSDFRYPINHDEKNTTEEKILRSLKGLLFMSQYLTYPHSAHSYDCGTFVIMYGICIMKGLYNMTNLDNYTMNKKITSEKILFGDKDMKDIRKKMAIEVFFGESSIIPFIYEKLGYKITKETQSDYKLFFPVANFNEDFTFDDDEKLFFYKKEKEKEYEQKIDYLVQINKIYEIYQDKLKKDVKDELLKYIILLEENQKCNEIIRLRNKLKKPRRIYLDSTIYN
jgi:hypothetical protein